MSGYFFCLVLGWLFPLIALFALVAEQCHFLCLQVGFALYEKYLFCYSGRAGGGGIRERGCFIRWVAGTDTLFICFAGEAGGGLKIQYCESSTDMAVMTPACEIDSRGCLPAVSARRIRTIYLHATCTYMYVA